MTLEPRFENQYTLRQIEAARRVLVDIGQVLASFGDAIVVVGGWVPDLLLPDAASAHIGSIDVDLALDAARLADGRYAELLTQILDTGRYERGDKDFQLVSVVDLSDGERPVRVEVDFVASHDVVLKKNHPKLVEGFRVLRRPAFAAAFMSPVSIGVSGPMVSGAVNTVHLRVASLPDFLVMKAHAIGGRDKPKDVYDLCYCLDEFPNAVAIVAADWNVRRDDSLIAAAVAILQEKFQSVDHYGPQQLAAFHGGGSFDEGAMYARRAFELVQRLLLSLH